MDLITDSPQKRRPPLGQRVALRIAMIIGLVSSAVLAPTAAHAAEDYSRIHYFQNWATGWCLESNSGSALFTKPCQQGNTWQQWRVSGLRGGGYAGHDRVWLQSRADSAWIMVDLNRPRMGGSQGSSISQFTARGPNWGNVQFVSTFQGRTTCLDGDPGGIVYSNSCNFGFYQTWRAIWS